MQDLAYWNNVFARAAKRRVSVCVQNHNPAPQCLGSRNIFKEDRQVIMVAAAAHGFELFGANDEQRFRPGRHRVALFYQSRKEPHGNVPLPKSELRFRPGSKHVEILVHRFNGVQEWEALNIKAGRQLLVDPYHPGAPDIFGQGGPDSKIPPV